MTLQVHLHCSVALRPMSLGLKWQHDAKTVIWLLVLPNAFRILQGQSSDVQACDGSDKHILFGCVSSGEAVLCLTCSVVLLAKQVNLQGRLLCKDFVHDACTCGFLVLSKGCHKLS